ncbi:hypothetical protein [Frigoribacterium sp. CFBP 13707]|uniref:hypothetical protein n=1 Tax=Frigoribacterium sp. CFBP 13707 TaxID=2775313 RepID=UPI001784BB02|nr:hypothetical protein [Frigoribacterium sp. CFBP 13707]MBD8728976.1 hypothetical protein [Frigoribacterium sp. CFBP 13707]
MTTTTHVTTACMFCHQASTINLTTDEAGAWQNGTLIQDAMPDRPADERELIRSGIHPACWRKAFGPSY